MYGVCMYNNFTYRLVWEYKYTSYELLKRYENIKQGRTCLQSPTLRISQVYTCFKIANICSSGVATSIFTMGS